MIIESLFFDMDGVVIDSEKLHLKALGLTLERNGIAYPEAMLTDFIGKPDRLFFEHARGHLDDGGRVNVEDFLKQKDSLFDSLLPEVCLVDGFEEFTREVKEHAIKTALVTSSPRWLVKEVDRLLDILVWFDAVVVEEDTVKHKPNPDPYLLAIERIGADTSSTAIIEDSPSGIMAGKAAGCRVFGLMTSFSKEVLKGAGADHAFGQFDGIASMIF